MEIEAMLHVMTYRINYFLCLIFFASIHINSHAACTIGSNANITLTNISFNRDIPVNTQFGIDIKSQTVNLYNCDASTTSIAPGVKMFTGNKVTTINGRDVYSTNINGIGAAAGMVITSPSNCPSTVAWIGSDTSPSVTGDGNIRNKLACTIKEGSTIAVNGYYVVALYKVAPLTGTGTLLMSSRIHGVLFADNTWIYPELLLNANSVTITPSTCSVSNQSITLPAVSSSALNKINDTAGLTSFSLGLDCPVTTKVAVTFTDKNNITQTGNILTLDSTSSAKGVGVQLSYNGNTVSFGPDSSIPGNTNQIQLGSITGQSTLQLNAAYIRTGAITPGSVSAAATFTFSYQ